MKTQQRYSRALSVCAFTLLVAACKGAAVDESQSGPQSYSPDEGAVCRAIDQGLKAAEEDFVALRGGVQSNNPSLRIWSAGEIAGASCQVIQWSETVTNYLCELGLPGPQSAENWHESMIQVVGRCLAEQGNWTVNNHKDRGGTVSLFESDAQATKVAVRYYLSDKSRSQEQWRGVVGMGKSFINNP